MSMDKALETLVANSGRIADALEALVKLGGASTTVIAAAAEVVAKDEAKPAAKVDKPKPAAKVDKPAPEPTPEPEPVVEPEPTPPAAEPDPLDGPGDEAKYTVDQVRAALKDYRDIEGSAAMMEVLRKHGADSLGALKPEAFAGVMADVK